VAHTCNPSYSGGRDQEDCSSKPARANSFARPYLGKPFTKIRLVEWLKVKALSSSASTAKKQNKTKPQKPTYHTINYMQMNILTNIYRNIEKACKDIY
jgi:hypothetical protein